MPQRKKNQNKENFRIPKKSTLQLFNYTQQLRMPTLATTDMRQAGRSIELVKSNHKKPVSRKTRCVSVKPSVCPNIKFKHMMRQIKSMKLMQNKEKSPSLNKLKSKSGKSSHKITQAQLNTVQNSQLNLTAKLQKTLKKLNQTDYFKDDQDSLIPLVSSSDAFTYAQKQNLLLNVVQNYDDINIRQMRAFCHNSQSVYKKSVQFLKGNIYDIMARRIQRAWRSYRTHKLVNRYVSLPIRYTPSISQEFINQIPEISQKSKFQQHKEIAIQSIELYQSQDQRKITYISNLDPEDQNVQVQQQQLKAIKQEQLKKWSYIIDLIHKSKSDNPADLQKLLKKLMNESQIYKKNLLEKQIFEIQQNQRNQSQEERQQQQSQKHQQFNSKKYIEYLDSDMYPIQPNLLSSNTISKNKQQQLLKKLSQPRYKGSKKFQINQNDFIQQEGKLLQIQLRQLNRDLNDQSKLSYRSLQSISQDSINLTQTINLQRQIDRQNFNRDFRDGTFKINKNIKNVLKCNSQKFFKKVHSNIQQPIIKQKQFDSNQKSIDPLSYTLQKQFQQQILQDTQIQRKSIHLGIIDDQGRRNQQKSYDKLYTQEELSKKLAQLKKLKQQDSDDDYGQIYPGEKQKNQNQQNKQSEQPILTRSTKQPLQDFGKINIQDYDRNIQSDSDQASDIAQKSQNIANMVFNSLIFDILKQMTKYSDTILKKFKEFSLKKPKIKRAQSKQKKNGFQTNQTQVKNFINQLCGYLLHDEPHIFKNLEKATGPSAIEMLRYMHQTSDQQIYLQDQDDDPSIMVMPNWVFDNYWLKKVLQLKYQKHGIDQQRQQQRQQYLKSLNKIFYRSLFDCLNQCLDFQRNFGPFGRPFPWKRAPVFNHIMTVQETKQSVQKSQKKLLEITSTYCGIIIQKQEMASICGNQQYLQQVQEDRLSRMLAQDLVQGQERWIFYDDEETQLLVQTSNIIFNIIIIQTLQLMQQLSTKDNQIE